MFVAPTLGDGHQHPAWHSHALSVAAARDQSAHAIADFPARDVLPELNDPARHVQAQDVRRAGRRRVMTGSLCQVSPVDRRGVVFDQDVVQAGYRIFGLGPHQGTALTLSLNVDSFHTTPPRYTWRIMPQGRVFGNQKGALLSLSWHNLI